MRDNIKTVMAKWVMIIKIHREGSEHEKYVYLSNQNKENGTNGTDLKQDDEVMVNGSNTVGITETPLKREQCWEINIPGMFTFGRRGFLILKSG